MCFVELPLAVMAPIWSGPASLFLAIYTIHSWYLVTFGLPGHHVVTWSPGHSSLLRSSPRRRRRGRRSPDVRRGRPTAAPALGSFSCSAVVVLVLVDVVDVVYGVVMIC